MIKERTIYIILTVIFPTVCLAGNIDNIIKEIKTNNLEIKSSIKDLESTRLELKSNNNLPDPEVEGSFVFGNSGSKKEISISQPFEWPGLYSSRNKTNNAQYNALRFLQQQKEIEIITNARQICYDIINVNKKIDFEKYVLSQIQVLHDAYQKGFNHGEVNILDMNKLKVEMINSNQQLETFEIEKRVLLESLKVINGNLEISNSDIENLDNYPITQLKPISYYNEILNTFNPMKDYYLSLSEADSQMLTTAKMQWFPNFSVGYKYSNEVREKFHGFVASVSIPLFSNRHKADAIKMRMISNSYAGENINIKQTGELISLYSQSESLLKQIEAYRKVVNDNNNYELLKKALDGGQINMLQYIMEMKYFTDVKFNVIELEYRYNNNMIQLEKYSSLTK